MKAVSKDVNMQMYPVPVLNENIRARGLLINQQSAAGRWLLTKRFFLADRRLDASRASELLRVPVHMSLHIHLQVTLDECQSLLVHIECRYREMVTFCLHIFVFDIIIHS